MKLIIFQNVINVYERSRPQSMSGNLTNASARYIEPTMKHADLILPNGLRNQIGISAVVTSWLHHVSTRLQPFVFLRFVYAINLTSI